MSSVLNQVSETKAAILESDMPIFASQDEARARTIKHLKRLIRILRKRITNDFTARDLGTFASTLESLAYRIPLDREADVTEELAKRHDVSDVEQYIWAKVKLSEPDLEADRLANRKSWSRNF